MADDIARLGIEVDSSDAKKAQADLNGLTRSANDAEIGAKRLKPGFDKASSSLRKVSRETKKTDRSLGSLEVTQRKNVAASSALTGAAGRLIVPLVSLTATVTALSRAFSVVQEYERFEAQLTTATGSVEAAALEMDALNDYAAKTPFQLNEVIDAFVRLKNLGLDPSQEALTSYGNTASSMGKSLNQFIEAVADATVGEFERLKEFGIKARSEGDNVAFTFAGVTTTVQKSAQDIERYLRQLGNTEFAGAMERRTDDIEVAFSNLGVAADKLTRKIADESGLTGAAKAAANALTSLFNSFSGAPRSVDIVESEIERLTAALETAVNPRAGNSLRSQLSDLREELQLARSISTDSGQVKKAIAELDAQINTYQETLSEFDGEPEKSVNTRRGSRTNPVYERYASTNELLEQAIKQREALIKRSDSLSQTKDSRDPDEVKGGLTGLSEDQLRDRFESVKSSLDSEEEAIKASFVRRQNALADYADVTGEFDQEYRDLSLANIQKYNNQLLELELKKLQERDGVRLDHAESETDRQQVIFETELEALRLHYEAGVIPTMNEYNERVAELTQRHQDTLTQIELENTRKRSMLVRNQQYSAFSSIMGLFRFMAGENEDVLRAIFLFEQAASVVRILQNGSVAAARALAELGPVAGPPAAASIKGWAAAEATATGALAIGQAFSSGSSGGSASFSAGGGLGYSNQPTTLSTPAVAQSFPEFSQNQQPRVQITVNGDITGLNEDVLADRFAELVEREYISVSGS